MAQTARLIEAVPARLRFSDAPDAPSKRNILIRNVSLGTLTVRVQLPGPPFQIVHGGERVGVEVKLQPQETWAFGVAVNRASLVPGRSLVCEFLVVKVDSCLPLPIDFVVAPDGMSKEEIQRFVQTRLPSSGASEALRPTLARADEGGACASDGGTPLAANLSEVGSAGASPTGSAAPAILAAFLGEAPAGAALRQLGPVDSGAHTGGNALGAAMRSGRGVGGPQCRGGREYSPPDTPVGHPDFHHCGDYDDDRPPTPVPAGFEAYRKQQSESPAAAASHRPSRPSSRDGALPSAPPQVRRPAEEPQPLRTFATASAPLQSLRRKLTPQRSCLSTASAVTAPERTVTLDVRSSRRPASLPPCKGLADGSENEEGLTWVEGVGWCDDYGDVVGGPGAQQSCGGAAGGLRRMRSTSQRRTGQQASLTALGPGRPRPKLRAADSMGSVKSRTGGCGIPKASGTLSSGASQKKLSQRELDSNWDALGGI